MILESFMLADRKFSIRRATETDVPRIIELMSNDEIRKAEKATSIAQQEGYLAGFHAIDADPSNLLVVVEDTAGVVMGTMQLTIIPGMARLGATRLLIEAVRIDETLRGQGIGSQMINWGLQEGSRRGAVLAQLTSDGSRKAAHRFYERLGFSASHVGFKMKL